MATQRIYIKKIRDQFNGLKKNSKEITEYFEFFPDLLKLVEKYRKSKVKRLRAWDALITYLFSRIERAHVMSIHCGIVKIHRVNPTLVWTAISKQNITRSNIIRFHRDIFGNKVAKKWEKKIDHAISVRNNILHGKEKNVTEAAKRRAVMEILRYSKLFNQTVHKRAGFKPFGDLRGYGPKKGEAQTNETSRWILKGIGFDIS